MVASAYRLIPQGGCFQKSLKRGVKLPFYLDPAKGRVNNVSQAYRCEDFTPSFNKWALADTAVLAQPLLARPLVSRTLPALPRSAFLAPSFQSPLQSSNFSTTFRRSNQLPPPPPPSSGTPPHNLGPIPINATVITPKVRHFPI